MDESWRNDVVLTIASAVEDSQSLFDSFIFLGQEEEARHGIDSSAVWKMLRMLLHSKQALADYITKVAKDNTDYSLRQKSMEEIQKAVNSNDGEYIPFTDFLVLGSIGFAKSYNILDSAHKMRLRDIILDQLADPSNQLILPCQEGTPKQAISFPSGVKVSMSRPEAPILGGLGLGSLAIMTGAHPALVFGAATIGTAAGCAYVKLKDCLQKPKASSTDEAYDFMGLSHNATFDDVRTTYQTRSREYAANNTFESDCLLVKLTESRDLIVENMTL